MIAVGIIAIVASIAFPSFIRARMRGQNAKVVKDMQSFADQFSIFNVEERRWPDDRIPGQFPNSVEGVSNLSMEQMIKRINWETAPPIGGQYDWDQGVNGIVAAVAIANPTADTVQLTTLDKMMDDGNLNTGSLRLANSGSGLIWVIQEK